LVLCSNGWALEVHIGICNAKYTHLLDLKLMGAQDNLMLDGHGGMITSTIHVLILVPVFFALMKEHALRRGT